mmetsp:Transcript_13917/g.28474  ORF Transcript_13917/g.28474 Transcript_13917/m.28474 type:complete len:122 (+) Transcript_13917:52-417(+)|eukprot:CAMPEP_0197552182 /NCGR_PEP_ID=MMETSP1320-20131121/5790_1 /TAXON_ID=91990 /ORGANISM="Bolidomonas sp., Strain RCC2347" /LENGTH=121 /DNA_ID=CAMNT_0043112755 /DNA_START=46 /DNA_END=411 /DNA_ORIENTATION=+
MRPLNLLLLVVLALLSLFSLPLATSFSPTLPFHPSLTSSKTILVSSSKTSLKFFGGGSPPPGKAVDWVCKDCGYVFPKPNSAFDKLDGKYQCPPCGAPKFRFKWVEKGSASGKVKVKKSWF